ncbi:MAG: hypothetical protein PVI71_05800 [Desulfobacterales bacterium]|jgi:hypothetical protein
MLSEFYNEVLAFGPVAVLPQNLNAKWIQRLQKMSDDFLDSNFNLYECKDAREIGDPTMAACVYEIVRYQYGDTFDLTPQEMAEKIVIYALSITMESVNRKSDYGLKPPSLDNILSMERILSYKRKKPEFVDLLREACIIRESDKGWFQNIKDKLISGIKGG